MYVCMDGWMDGWMNECLQAETMRIKQQVRVKQRIYGIPITISTLSLKAHIQREYIYT